MWIVAPILYYSNVLYSSYMPILSASVFDNKGKAYNVSKILRQDFTFDAEAYHGYSPVFLPITYVLSYALQFASLTALLTHTICWHGQDISKQTRESFRTPSPSLQTDYQPLSARSTDALLGNQQENVSKDRNTQHRTPDATVYQDVHNRLMKRYLDVPASWYLITGISMLATGMFVVE